MRIALITEAYTPIKNGVVHVVELSKNELQNRGHLVKVITPTNEKVHSNKNGIVDVPSIPLPGGSGYRLSFPRLSDAEKILKKADIIHTHHPFVMGRWAQKLAEKYQKPFLFTNHTQYVNYMHHIPAVGGALTEPVNNFVVKFANRCTVVIAPALSTREQLIKDGVTAPIQHVPNGIEVDRFGRGQGKLFRERIGLDLRTPLHVYTGRIAPEKNLEFLIRAVASIKTRPQLALVGGGPQLDELRQLVRNLKAVDHIHLIGPLNYHQIPDAYAAANVFVTASVTEVHPLVILEAFAAHLPAVVIKARGTADIVEDGKTGLTTNKTRSDFTNAINKLLKDSNLRYRYGQNAHKVASSKYSIQASVDTLLDTYRLAIKLKEKEA